MMAKIDSQTIEIMANILKSPADAVAIVKGSDEALSVSTISGIVGMVSTLASAMVEDPKIKAGLSKLGLGASVAGFLNDAYDVAFRNKTDDRTITSLLANTIAVAGGVLALGSGIKGSELNF